jgi:hypothetical protein
MGRETNFAHCDAFNAQTAAAWQAVLTKVPLGQDDVMPEEDVRWALENFDNVRFIESDRFVIFRHPESVADLVLESLS